MTRPRINVTKRDGRKEPLDYEKLHTMLYWATEGIKHVSISDIAMKADLQLYDGIPTKDIHNALIQATVELITPKAPQFQYVASKLLNYYIRKEIFGKANDLPHLGKLINKNVKKGIYDPIILEKYDREDIDMINDIIKHERDFKLSFGGIQQMVDKYLLQDRTNGEVFETPQYAYIVIAMTLFADMDHGKRINQIRKFYNDISTFKISLPTPVMCGVRTKVRQYSSCVLLDVGDGIDSIFATNHAMGRYIAQRAGIGLNFGRLRAIGSSIRGGEVVHTGVIPFLKVFEATTKSCSQSGVRGGSSTTHFPFWHQEIQDVITLKSNKRSAETAVRKLDYSVQFCRLFYKRLVEDGDITLFSPNDVPGLYEAFGYNDKFESLYTKYEKDKSIKKTTVPARDFMNAFCQERGNTGRIYLQNIDHVNENSPFLDKISMSNLCQEIALPTTPLTDVNQVNNQAEIATCVLSAINLGTVSMKKLHLLEGICENVVRALDYIIDAQQYPVKAAEEMIKRRSLGVGVTNLAYFLAKNNVSYSDPNALAIVDEVMEHIQYYLIKASVKLSKENGPCEYFDRTTYSKGIMPVDRYNKNVDSLVKRTNTLDWDALRSDVLEHGMRNSTLSAIMPCESSSVVSNSTNGIEPPRDASIIKQSKMGLLKTVLPDIHRLANKYEYAFEMPDNKGYLNIASVIQKWIDQSISTNTYYNPLMYESGKVPVSEIVYDLLHGYQHGLKNFYYHNTLDLDDTSADDGSGCESGACAV